MIFSDPRFKVLDNLYAVYDQFTDTRHIACKRFCADCCTCNVTLTSLEAAWIMTGLDGGEKLNLFEKIGKTLTNPRFIPKITLNQLADICMQGGDPPDEEIDPTWGACPLLRDKTCTIYAVRPFGCRCMTSFRKCSETGAADMDDFTLTVNHVFLQTIENLDKNGYFGNMSDMLAQTLNKKAAGPHPPPLIRNSPLSALLIPPEHREKIQPILDSIRAALQAIKI
jgi:hypothetical protein